MKILTASLLAYGAAIALSLSPLGHADAQPDTAAAASPTHGDWTLREREKWVSDRIDKSRDDGALDRGEYDRARHGLVVGRDTRGDRSGSEVAGQMADGDKAARR